MIKLTKLETITVYGNPTPSPIHWNSIGSYAAHTANVPPFTYEDIRSAVLINIEDVSLVMQTDNKDPSKGSTLNLKSGFSLAVTESVDAIYSIIAGEKLEKALNL